MNKQKISPQAMTDYESCLRQKELSEATVEKYLRHVRSFAAWLEGRELSRESVAAWRSHLLDKNYSPSTINGALAALNGLLSMMGRADCCAKYLKVQRRMFRDLARELTKPEYM